MKRQREDIHLGKEKGYTGKRVWNGNAGRDRREDTETLRIWHKAAARTEGFAAFRETIMNA